MVRYDPFDPEIIHGDPHPIYKRLRDEAPAYHIERYDCWALSRFEDVWNAGDDLGFSHGTHACLGLHAARAEARLGIQEFLSRFQAYEVQEDGIERFETEFVQGYSQLPIRLRPQTVHQAKVHA